MLPASAVSTDFTSGFASNFANFSADNPSGSSEVMSLPCRVLSTSSWMPEDKEEFALTMNGKKTHLRRGDFLTFADTAGIQRKAAEAMIHKLLGFVPEWIKLCNESLLPYDMQQNLAKLIQERSERML